MKKQFLFCYLIFSSILVWSQDIRVQMSHPNIALNEAFTITITLNNEQIRSYGGFPEIPSFQKRGVSSQSSTNIVNGQISFSQSYTQNYTPTKEGKFKLPNFNIEVNGKTIQAAGTVIVVGPAKQQQQQNDPFGNDPFADFFGRGGGKREFVDIKEEAFLALNTNKDKVYIGEGFTATLAFYISESNKAQMNFHELGKQMQEIVKKLKPTNCWEENFGIEEIQPEQVTINGKRYTEYKLYRATYYPLNKEPVRFLSLPLIMIKYKVAKNPSFFGQNMQQDFKTFYTKPKIIGVKDLPPHPLKDQVAVGNYKLEEQFSTKKMVTGKSFNYQFKIIGDGNTASVKEPLQTENKNFEIYPPNVFQNITRTGTAVLGTKNYNYFVVPKEPGKYKLGDYIYWIYFNTKTARYDTLKSSISLTIKGESTLNKSVSSNDYSGFLDLISNYDDKIISSDKTKYFKMLANIFLLFIFIVTLVISLKK
ncbi:MAG: hypothetical protein EAZ53_01080 [Bacteroidetes bacterium]|nr:MAG: hypothetical protein EAZ53_01080 [Bacteroidota bacterium]